MERRLDVRSWVRQGIITREQADAIEAYELRAPPPGLLRWHPFWFHVTVFVATLSVVFAAVLLLEYGDFGARPLAVGLFLVGAGALVSPWTTLRDLHPMYREAMLVVGALLVTSASMLTPSEAASEVLLVLSVFLLAIAFLVQSRPGIRILLGTVLMLTVAGSIEAFAPTGWESQIIAFVVVSTLLVLMAWQVPRGPYRSTLFLVAALMGFLGLGTGAYAIAAGSLTAIAAALLSAAYLGVVWAAWTGRLRPVEIPPLHPRM